ncbi:hypothetical protein VTJ83DRAFT_4124 [Remersonia thermophila]|uniref:Efficient mitochondria targeting-associated protein 19 n=1 Tax=Remersonia thermophila TaxID=72144 RepID=A0ABR4D999_9PEZI
MATQNRTRKNKAWLAWFLMQLPIIFFMDLLEVIWPAWVYQPVGSPLHFFWGVKEWYIQKYNDPILQWTPETSSGHDNWIRLFLYLELAFLLPTTLYGVFRLGVQRRGTSGADELLFFVYAFEMAFTTLVCIHHTFYLDDAMYPADVKKEMQLQLYGPFLVIPILGAIDMASRILGRIKVADAAMGEKKLQ